MHVIMVMRLQLVTNGAKPAAKPQKDDDEDDDSEEESEEEAKVSWFSSLLSSQSFV